MLATTCSSRLIVVERSSGAVVPFVASPEIRASPTSTSKKHVASHATWERSPTSLGAASWASSLARGAGGIGRGAAREHRGEGDGGDGEVMEAVAYASRLGVYRYAGVRRR